MIENLTTIVGLLVFVYLCYQAGRLLNRFKHRRFTKAWQPLIGIINGKVHEDPQGGGASSWLAGEWRGRTIHARMTPDVRTMEATHHHNQFAVGVAEQTGRSSWRADSRGLPFTRPELVISSDEAELRERLRGAGVVALLEGAQCRVARFDRHSGYLFVEEDVSPLWIPPPLRFVALLDLAVELARVQAEVNAR